MPELLTKRLRIMTVYGWVEPICILLGFFFGAMFLLTAFNARPLGIVAVLAILCLFSFGILIAFDQYLRHLRRQSDMSPYRIPIHASDHESICIMLNAAAVDTDGSVAFHRRRECSIRLLIQSCAEFLPREVSSRRRALNRKVNQRFPGPQDGPMSEVLKRMRINLVVCGPENDHAASWASRDAEHLLDRNEAIVNAAVCLETQVLLFPAVLGSLNFAQVRKYRAAAELLFENLSAGVEK